MIYSILLLVSSTFVNAIDVSKYPPILKVPPINASWKAALNIGRIDPPITQCPSSNTWAVSYDDGPSPFTPVALNALSKYNVKGTFFVVGSNALQLPDTVLRAFNEGHQIAIHTWSHPHLTTLSDDQILAEIVWTMKLVKEITGVTPTHFRPPYGEYDDRVLAIATALGLKTIIWNRDTNDWMFSDYVPGKKMGPPFQPNDDPSAISNWFNSWVKDSTGSVSLEHDLYAITTSQIEPALDILKKSSFSVTNVVGCIGGNAYDEGIWSVLDSSSTSSSTSSSATFTATTSTEPSSATSITTATTSFGSTTISKGPKPSPSSDRNQSQTFPSTTSTSTTLGEFVGIGNGGTLRITSTTTSTFSPYSIESNESQSTPQSTFTPEIIVSNATQLSMSIAMILIISFLVFVI